MSDQYAFARESAKAYARTLPRLTVQTRRRRGQKMKREVEFTCGFKVAIPLGEMLPEKVEIMDHAENLHHALCRANCRGS